MRKFVSLLTAGMLCFVLTFAQSRTVSGVVTGPDGKPVPFATLTLKGKPNVGVSADADGKFIFKNFPTGGVLVITSAGFAEKEVTPGTSDVVNVAMANSTQGDLQEVVVTTAFGIKKSERTTPFSAQQVTADQLNVTRQNQVSNALTGKVAGAQGLGQSSVALDRNTTIRLRGGAGIGTDGNPVYVVDGNIVNIFDINPDDVENITVLKGANATALFGSQAAGGAIVLDLKKKVGKNGIGLEINSGVTIDRIYIQPKFQNLYAGGGAGDLIQYSYQPGQPTEWQALDGKYFHDYTDDASWGPRMSGQEYIPWYAWFPNHPYSFKTASLSPQPDNTKDFWNTGITTNNNVSFGKSNNGTSYRVSMTNQYQKGLLPGSYSNKNFVSSYLSFDLNSHFTVDANINYVTQQIRGEFSDGYANNSSGSFSQWFHRDLNMDILKELADYKSPNGSYMSWNLLTNPDGAGGYDDIIGNYWYNFYSYQKGRSDIQRLNRTWGNVSLTYKLDNHFRVKGTIRTNYRTSNNETIVTSLLEASAGQAGYLASYATSNNVFQRYDYEAQAIYNNKFGDFSVSGILGGNIQKEQTKNVAANTNNGLNVPDLYSITNSAAQPSISNTRSAYQVNSLFGTGDIEYKKVASVTFGLRQDWYSTNNPNDNALFSPSAGVSLIFSELMKSKPSWFTYGKFFGSWGKKPLPLGIYALGFVYSPNQFLWDGNFLMGTPNTFPDPTVNGSVVTTYETGVDLKFLKNKLGVNLVYYHEINDKAPVNVGLPSTTGFTTTTTNAARVDRYGIEAIITATPVASKNFNWNISKTFGYLIGNPVKEIIDGQTELLLAGGSFGTRFARAFQIKGKDWGMLRGGGIKRNADGLMVVNPTTGQYVRDASKEWGSVIPKVTGGVLNTFSFKNVDLTVLVDYQFGGKFFSLSEQWGHFSGLYEATASLNDNGKNIRDALADGGGVHVVGVSSVDEKTPVDVYLDATTYWRQFYFNQIAEPFVHDLTFVKLREISLGYRLPVSKIGFLKKTFQGASLSVIGRNLWLIYSETKNFDPSEISAIYGENGQFPGSRSIGVNLKLTF